MHWVDTSLLVFGSFAYPLSFWEVLQLLLLSVDPTLKVPVVCLFKWALIMFAFVWLEKQKPTSSHWQNPIKKNKKTTSAATAAGCGTGRRGGSNQEREENNWPEATREREVTWLLSWPRAREGSSRKGWSQSGPALCCFWWVPLRPSSPPNPVLLPPPPPPRPPSPHGRLSRLTTSEQNDQLSSPLEHGSSW